MCIYRVVLQRYISREHLYRLTVVIITLTFIITLALGCTYFMILKRLWLLKLFEVLNYYVSVFIFPSIIQEITLSLNSALYMEGLATHWGGILSFQLCQVCQLQHMIAAMQSTMTPQTLEQA